MNTHPAKKTTGFRSFSRRVTRFAAAVSRRVPERAQMPLLIGLMMLFSASLSLLVLSHQSLRLDEAQSLWQSSRTPVGILRFVAQDVHVPLYNLLLHFWQFFFGGAVETARMMSLVPYVLMIPMVYLIGRKVYGRGVGLFAALLITISPFMNWYGNEIKMYAMLTLLTVVNQYFFIKVFRNEGGFAWPGYYMSAVAGIYTHYFFAFTLISQAVFFFMKYRSFPKKSFRKFVLTAVGIAAALAPWLTFAATSGAGSFFKPMLAEPTTVDLFNTYSQFIFGFQDDALNTLLVSLWPVTVLLGFFALRRRQNVSSETFYFLLAGTLPIAAAFIISITISPFYLSRYLIIALPSLYLFLGWVFSTYPKKLSLTLRTVLVAGMVVTLGHQTLSANTPLKEDYQDASAYLSDQVTPSDAVVLSAPFTVYPVEYYYTGSATLTTLPFWDRYTYAPIPAFSEENLVKDVKSLTEKNQKAYLLLSVDQGYQDKIKSYFDNNFTKLETRQFSPDLVLHVYKIRYDNARVQLDNVAPPA